ncbi:MAG: permease-like cell division protein FtsX [Candidatus Pacebacteria bacterium]|nr:permease-like cell division protein FtsX [Candidatus Paceibacterota bacterium]MDD5357080.1 permease-like cell division protein FtsX [Candidatus Paceibacterota bacterium]
MLWTKIKRVFRAGFTSFWRNGFVSLASVLVLIVTLFVIGSLIFASATLSSTLTQIQNKVDINVYFVTTASEDDILSLKKTLEALPEVAHVDYISRDKALADFKEKHQTDQLTLQALDELGDNPLGAVLNIKAKDPSQYEGIATFLNGKNALSSDGNTIIDKVNYFQNKIAIDRLTRIIQAGQKLGFTLTIILAIISVLITFNTIRLAIYTAREEISVMRLVGASNRYIRGPFVVTGIFYGLISALFTLVLFYPITFWLGPKTENFFTGINIFDYYKANFGEIFLIITLSGIFISAVSSFLATRKYLKI